MKFNPDSYASQWIIRGILPVGVTMLVGDSGTFKTLTAIDLCFRIALGMDFLGIPIEPGQVVYFVGEGDRGFPARLEAWKRLHRLTEADMHAIRNRFLWTTLGKVPGLRFDEHNEMLKAVRDLFSQMDEGNRPKLVVIDTRSVFGSGDENSADDTGEFIRTLKEIATCWGCGVLFIHHRGKGNKNEGDASSFEKSSRGSIAHEADSDAVIYAFRNKRLSGAGYWISKQRDGSDEWGWKSTTASVTLIESNSTIQSIAVSSSCRADSLDEVLGESGQNPPGRPEEKRRKQALRFAKSIDVNIFDRDTLKLHLKNTGFDGNLNNETNPNREGSTLSTWLKYKFVRNSGNPDEGCYCFSDDIWKASHDEAI